MSSSSSWTEHTDRRAWAEQPEHVVLLPGLTDTRYRDKTTNCHTKQYLLDVLGPQIGASRQHNFPLSLVLAEMAHLRQIRFTYGSSMVDKILEETATLLRANIRSTDLLIRYANEIYGLLLLHANRHGTELVCRRLRSAISKHIFCGKGSDTILTVNFGAAEQTGLYDLEGKELLTEASKALAAANQIGHSAIVIAGINL